MRRLALGTLALALALAGCGGSGSKSGGGKPISGDAIVAAAVKSSKAGSVEADFKIGGVSTTHYKVTVDLERAAARPSGSGRRSLQRVIQSTGTKKLPVDVWVDGDGYVRKVEYSQGSGNGKAVKVTMELHDFGSPKQIEAPPAASVIDFQKALGG